MRKEIFLVSLIVIILLFFWKFFVQGLLPIPADTIVGMYHPWRDFYAQEYPNGIPFKNFLITDSVRQQYPWRKLGIELLRKGQWPVWNPYTFAGTPLLANFQSAVFYPLNILFFIPKLSFARVWSFLVVLQLFLAGLFLYLYLCHWQLRPEACFLGGISFAFSGFFTAWLEWNTILHAALWLPLILLAVEKVIYYVCHPELDSGSAVLKLIQNDGGIQNDARKRLILWSTVFLISLISSFFAGHLQTFFYVFLISLVYIGVRTLSLKKRSRSRAILLFVICYLLFTALSAVQWLPTLKFINLSAREVDQIDWQEKEGWFVPWRHLVQFLAPDFFGNPATLNYWGAWNYGELVGYIGVLPLIMAFLALIWRKDKKTLFFGSSFFLSLIFALPTWFAKLPYQLKLPFLSTSQPTRLLFLTDFSLAILAALGFDYFLRKKTSIIQIIEVIISLSVLYVALWTFVLIGNRWLINEEWFTNLAVAKRNLILPTGLFIISAILLLFSSLRERAFAHSRSVFKLVTCCLLLVTCGDLFRFGWKFTPFTKKEYLFPKTKTVEFLEKQKKPFRIMATDRRIFPPNFSSVFKLESVEGYDPLYLQRYGGLIAASERGKPDIFKPFGFNRIITPQNYDSRIMDLLNVKYVLSLDDLDSERLVKVFEEGKTKVYENKNVFPRAFMVYDYQIAKDKQETIEIMMDENTDLGKTVISEEKLILKQVQDDEEVQDNKRYVAPEVKVKEYRENRVIIDVNTSKEGILVLTDNYYPDRKVFIDARENKVYRVDYNLQGVIIPVGRHEVVFTI